MKIAVVSPHTRGNHSESIHIEGCSGITDSVRRFGGEVYRFDVPSVKDYIESEIAEMEEQDQYYNSSDFHICECCKRNK